LVVVELASRAVGAVESEFRLGARVFGVVDEECAPALPVAARHAALDAP